VNAAAFVTIYRLKTNAQTSWDYSRFQILINKFMLAGVHKILYVKIQSWNLLLFVRSVIRNFSCCAHLLSPFLVCFVVQLLATLG
jgi:hypothetical protein